MENLEKIKIELSLYKLREIEIEDMSLKIEQLELCDNLGSPGFDEKVQTSINCRNNDSNMNQIETLRKKIKLYQILNKRVDNALKILGKEEKEVITMVFIDKKSRTRTARELFKDRKCVNKIINQALPKLKLN